MLSELDCKILARAVGFCWRWHEWVFYGVDEDGFHFWQCECGQKLYNKDNCGKPPSFFFPHICTNPTFTTADDWEMVRVKVILPNILLFESIIYDNGIQWWLQKTSHELCQTTVDIIKSRPDLFPWVEEMEEVKE